MFLRVALIVYLVLAVVSNAQAYVGPGLGLGAIGAIFGVIVAVILAVLGVVWYPLKRLFKGKKTD